MPVDARRGLDHDVAAAENKKNTLDSPVLDDGGAKQDARVMLADARGQGYDGAAAQNKTENTVDPAPADDRGAEEGASADEQP